MKTYQVVGLLPKEQQNILLQLKPKQKVSTGVLRTSVKHSQHEFRSNMNGLLKKGLVSLCANPLNKRTKLYSLSVKGVEVKNFIMG